MPVIDQERQDKPNSPDGDDASTSYAASLESIKAARARISTYIHRTQIQTSEALDEIAGTKLFFKCEMYQRGGAFKFRGACNAVFSLSDAQACKGVVTHSSGNHAAALALAARLRGVPAHIVIPNNTPQCKKDATRTYGGLLTECKPTMDAREQTCQRIQEETGATFIPPYNDPQVISGQGTAGLELLEQVPALDAIIVPVSGGGLISGISIAAKALHPSIAIIAAEPHGRNNAADCAASKAAGRIVVCPKTQTIADGLQGRLGSLTWPPVRDLVKLVVTVSEQEIVAAMQLIFERMKSQYMPPSSELLLAIATQGASFPISSSITSSVQVVVEPSGAVALAAALSKQFRESADWNKFRNIGVLLSGGNVDLAAKGFWDLWPL